MGISKFFRGDTLKYRLFLTDKASGTPISVDRGTLTFSMKRRQRDAVPVIEVIVESSEFNIFQPTGMIDLTVPSSLTANLRPGTHFYDFIMFGIDRAQCLKYRKIIIDFIDKVLCLKLSKSTIKKIKKGLNFVGYRTWKSKKFIRKYSLYKFRKKVKQNKQESVVSLLGHAKNTNSIF